MRVAAIVPAAGTGSRLGGETPKQFVQIAGRSILVHSLLALEAAASVHEVVVVVPKGMEARTETEFINPAKILKVTAIVAGGESRQESVRAGLKAVGADIEGILVHDAARPLVTPDLIDRVVETAKRTGAAIAAVPMQDTPKVAAPTGLIAATLDRSRLWLAQTPQAFEISLFRQASALAAAGGTQATDESALVEALGRDVTIVEGDWDNFKITEPVHLRVAEWLLNLRANPRSP